VAGFGYPRTRMAPLLKGRRTVGYRTRASKGGERRRKAMSLAVRVVYALFWTVFWLLLATAVFAYTMAILTYLEIV
jgi:hypothetical protein